MTDRPRATRSEELLFERERRGIRTLCFVRGILSLILVISHWVVGASLFEKIAATAITVPALIAVGASLFFLAQRKHVGAVGLIGCTIDIAIMCVLPVIWYFSVGGTDVSPTYMLKTQVTVVTLTIVALNALAITPLYPILVAGGGVAVHMALLGYVLSVPGAVISSDFLDSVMGPALSVEFVITSMITIAGVGAAMGYLTRAARRTVIQGVRLEVANAHLGRYFSPGVVSRISSEADGVLETGGRTQEVAVMFCDMRDFTHMTEKLPPPEVVDLLSQYHTRMVEVIFRFGGTIDKFIGDAIMVTFGTPDPKPDDAERAVRAGLAMNEALAALNADRAKTGLAEIRHGIGIHVGPVIAGNIGTKDRLEYTVIGDTVNVASRIQDACKPLGEAFLISDAVKAQLPADIPVRALPEQHVKGREAPVQIYAVGDPADGH
jgi:adenylate cyclase